MTWIGLPGREMVRFVGSKPYQLTEVALVPIGN